MQDTTSFRLHALERKDFLAIAAAIGLFIFGYFVDDFTIRGFIVGIFGVLATLILTTTYERAIQILFFYLGFEGMAKVVSGYHPAVHIGSDLILLALTLRWCLSFLLQKNTLPKERPPFQLLFLFYFIWFLIEYFNPYSLGIFASLVGFKNYVIPLVLYVFGFYLAKNTRQIQGFMKVWLATGLLQIVAGLLQSLYGSISVLSISQNYALPLRLFTQEGSAFRPFGLTAVAGGAAIFMYLMTPIMLYFTFQAKDRMVRYLLPALTPAIALLLLVCQVRSALLKTLVSLFLFISLSLGRASAIARKRLIIAIPFLTAGLAFTLPQLTTLWVESVSESGRGIERTLTLFDLNKVRIAREGAWTQILQAATQAPLGAGLSWTGPGRTFFQDAINGHPFFPGGFWSDNFWATTIFEIGVPGSALLTLLIFLILVKGLQQQFSLRTQDLRLISACLLSSLTAIVVGLWGAQGILYNPEAFYFWFFAGVMMKLPYL